MAGGRGAEDAAELRRRSAAKESEGGGSSPRDRCRAMLFALSTANWRSSAELMCVGEGYRCGKGCAREAYIVSLIEHILPSVSLST
jgi:hypothetical protein